jgi:cytochrome d ubiquinol oxidase subunit I
VDDVLFARLQIAFSLGFHIIFAAIGIAMPLMMVIAEKRWLRTGDRDYLDLTKAWAKGSAILIAIGAASGTVLSFELGLLFPTFMRHAGAIIGMPFSLEGFAFFAEAIFLGIYLYAWNLISPRLHLLAGGLVALSGALSAVFVITANAWMNAPRGFRLEDGKFVDIDPIAGMLNPYAIHEIVHMLVAAYLATGILVAAIHAAILLRHPGSALHRKAFSIAMAMVIPMAIVQPLVGDLSARQVAQYQPLKFAAMEGQYETRTHAPLRIGGIPRNDLRETTWAIEIPGMLSFLGYGKASAEVRGLEEWPEEDWPHAIVHYGFQLMVLLGILLLAHSAWAVLHWLFRGRRLPTSRAFLWCTVVAGPLGMIAIEAGWIVTEVGRQPWVIYEILRTKEAATPMPNMIVPFTVTLLVYLGLSAAVILVLRRQIRIAPGLPAPAPAPVQENEEGDGP